MKYGIFIGWMLMTMFSYAQKIDIHQVRVDYQQAVQDEDLCLKNLELLQKSATSSTEKGYLAVYEMVKAKHSNNPFTKLSQFNKGKKLLENTIASSPNNIELRFLRWSVQSYTPKILNYNNNLEQDKKFLVQNLRQMKDPDGKALLFKYLKGSNQFSESDLNTMQN